MPERDDIAGCKFYIVFYDKSVRDIFYLFFSFLASPDFERVVINPEIGYRGSYYVMIDSRLVEEKSFTDISNLGFFAPEVVYQVRVVKIYFFHLA